jgi:hypothetical protein
MATFDADGEIYVGDTHPEVQKKLDEVTGKYQEAILALLLIGLPSAKWRNFSSGTLPLDPPVFFNELLSYGFSKSFACKWAKQETIDLWRANADDLNNLRAGLVGPGGLNLIRYSANDPCQTSKLVTMVHQARAAESAVRTQVLLQNDL